uniref:Uncharacterized protein n=1 Tax=Gouania willdenowi TaxID=441366 RepID=A0A8C5EEA2_GOUWI
MKTLSVFVAVAIVLTVMCSQQSSAVPGEELEETIFLEIPGGAMNETVMDSMKVRACSNTPDSDLKLCHCDCLSSFFTTEGITHNFLRQNIKAISQ